MKIYGDIKSGNCFKIKLLAEFLGLTYEWIHIDIMADETQTPEFLAMNPNGKVPLLVLDDGRCLSESNAILNYLGEGTEFLPREVFDRAKVLEWQFFEQYSHEPYIAVARFINTYLGMPEDRKADFDSKQEGGHKALQIMEKQLSNTDFLVGNSVTIADLSLYGYTHVADEGGFDLSEYPAVQAWINRIQQLPNYVGME